MTKVKAQKSTEAIRSLQIGSWVSVVVSILVLLLKLIAYKMTHSTAVLSDALESIVNVVAAVMATTIISMVVEPADDKHPYGHGKLEYFSSAFEGGLVFFAALAIAFESIRSFITGESLHELDKGIFVVILGAIINLALALYLRQIAKKNNSDALLASSQHVLSDFWTTAALVGGLGIIKLTGLFFLDSILALAVGIHLVFSSYKIVRKAISGLIDEVDPHVLKELVRAISKNRRAGMIDIHELRMIRSGAFHHVDAHLVVPEYWELSKVHDVTEAFGGDIVRDYLFDGEMAFHLDPCRQAYCSVCNIFDCPIRMKQFKSLKTFTVEKIIKGPQPSDTGIALETKSDSNRSNIADKFNK